MLIGKQLLMTVHEWPSLTHPALIFDLPRAIFERSSPSTARLTVAQVNSSICRPKERVGKCDEHSICWDRAGAI